MFAFNYIVNVIFLFLIPLAFSIPIPYGFFKSSNIPYIFAYFLYVL